MFCWQKLVRMNAQVFKCAGGIEVIHGDDVIWCMKSLIGSLKCAFYTISGEKFHACKLSTCSVSGSHVVTDTRGNWTCSVLVRWAPLQTSQHALARRRAALREQTASCTAERGLRPAHTKPVPQRQRGVGYINPTAHAE